MIHLYVDPVARRYWCSGKGVEFVLPPQQNSLPAGAQDSSLAREGRQYQLETGIAGSSQEAPPSYEEVVSVSVRSNENNNIKYGLQGANIS